MSLELKPLRCFVILAEELNFRRAAARINLTQPALSAQIRALERQLGFALFERSTRRVELTGRGETLLAPARHLVEQGSRLWQLAEQLRPRGARRMQLGAAFYTIDIPERVALLEGVFDRHPDIALDVSTAYQNALIPMLQRGEIDVALLLGLPVERSRYTAELDRHPLVETIFPDDLERIVLRRERVGLLVPRELAPASELPPELPLAALAGRKVAMLGRGHGGPLIDPILRVLAEAGATPITPPESHAVGVERYARQFLIPGISLGWFGLDDPCMVRCHVEGLTLETEFSVVRSPPSAAGGLEPFWAVAQGGAARRND
ncbi:LysR family transcriptional regulator [Sphingomonas adhaesiva]|uniref:LysR family transcriptional regulator n=1 Tax=Sphingomonas adhaesiva TaxID=28212 RepID=UPI002FFD4B66